MGIRNIILEIQKALMFDGTRQKIAEKRLKKKYSITKLGMKATPEYKGWVERVIRPGNDARYFGIWGIFRGKESYEELEIKFNDGDEINIEHGEERQKEGYGNSLLVKYSLSYIRQNRDWANISEDFEENIGTRRISVKGEDTLENLALQMSRAYNFVHGTRFHSIEKYGRVPALIEVGSYITSRLPGIKTEIEQG